MVDFSNLNSTLEFFNDCLQFSHVPGLFLEELLALKTFFGPMMELNGKSCRLEKCVGQTLFIQNYQQDHVGTLVKSKTNISWEIIDKHQNR